MGETNTGSNSKQSGGQNGEQKRLSESETRKFEKSAEVEQLPSGKPTEANDPFKNK